MYYTLYNILEEDYLESLKIFNEWNLNGDNYEGEEELKIRFNSIHKNRTKQGGENFKIKNLLNLIKYILYDTRKQRITEENIDKLNREYPNNLIKGITDSLRNITIDENQKKILQNYLSNFGEIIGSNTKNKILYNNI